MIVRCGCDTCQWLADNADRAILAIERTGQLASDERADKDGRVSPL